MTTQEEKKFYRMLGDCIRASRIKSGLKQEAFASFINLSRASVVNIEKGRQHPPIHLLWVIARTLNISVTELLPNFNHEEQISHKWKKLIEKQTKGDQGANQKLVSFISEIQTANSQFNVK